MTDRPPWLSVNGLGFITPAAASFTNVVVKFQANGLSMALPSGSTGDDVYWFFVGLASEGISGITPAGFTLDGDEDIGAVNPSKGRRYILVRGGGDTTASFGSTPENGVVAVLLDLPTGGTASYETDDMDIDATMGSSGTWWAIVWTEDDPVPQAGNTFSFVDQVIHYGNALTVFTGTGTPRLHLAPTTGIRGTTDTRYWLIKEA